MRPGEQLMQDAWLGDDWPPPIGFRYGEQEPQPPFDVDQEVAYLRRAASPPRPDRSFDLPVEDPEVDFRALREARESVHAAVSSMGVHAIAWYVPYRLHGRRRWGIYFDVASMDLFARDLYEDANRLDSSVTFGMTLEHAYSRVMRHEVEHLVQELLMAESMVMGACRGFDVIQVRAPSNAASTEILATQMEVIDSFDRRPLLPGVAQAALSAAWSQLPLPDPYVRWCSDARVTHEASLRQRLRRLDDEAWSSMRQRVGPRGRSRFVSVPLYLWTGSRHIASISGASLRLAVDCRKARRGLLRTSSEQLLGVPFSITEGTKHELKIKFKGARRSIPFDCHAWDKVPDVVVSEIAKAVGGTRRDVIRALAAL